jgi:hypothetical protein
MARKKNSPKKKKLIFGIIVVALSLQALVIYLNFWVNNNILDILNENPNRSYDIEFSEVSFSLWSRSILVEDLAIKNNKNANQYGSTLSGNIEEIQINYISIFNLLINKKITTGEVKILNPQLYILSRNENQRAAENSKSLNRFWSNFYSSIQLSNVALVDGQITVERASKNQVTFKSENINISISDVELDSLKSTNPLPFSYSSIRINIGKTYSELGELYKTEVDSFAGTDDNLYIKNIVLKPNLNKKEFLKSIKVEQDYITSTIKSVTLDKTYWGFYKDSLLVKSKQLAIDSLDITFFRDKSPPDNLKKKILYNQLIRNLSFFLAIEDFEIKNSRICVEEKGINKVETGKITFENIHARGSHLSNLDYQNDSIPVKLNFKSDFLGDAPLEVNLSFNVNDLNDEYYLNGTLQNFDISSMDSFIEPNFNIKAEGEINHLDFMIHGADYDASARIKVDYEDLKIQVLNKNTKRKKLLTSAVGNLLLDKNKTDEESEYTEVYGKRNIQKSIYNQMVKMILDGLKKSMMI